MDPKPPSAWGRNGLSKEHACPGPTGKAPPRGGGAGGVLFDKVFVLWCDLRVWTHVRIVSSLYRRRNVVGRKMCVVHKGAQYSNCRADGKTPHQLRYRNSEKSYIKIGPIKKPRALPNFFDVSNSEQKDCITYDHHTESENTTHKSRNE